MDHRKEIQVSETIFLSYSQEDVCWVAHGLRTDQIGTGKSVLEALADAIRAIDGVFMLAWDDPTVAYLREAPAEIQEKARNAPLLPREIYEIAHRRVRGDWPDEVPVQVNPGNDKQFVTRIDPREEVACGPATS